MGTLDLQERAIAAADEQQAEAPECVSLQERIALDRQHGLNPTAEQQQADLQANGAQIRVLLSFADKTKNQQKRNGETTMPKVLVNNREVDIPDSTTGAELRTLAKINPERQLLRQDQGTYTPVSPRDVVQATDGDQFVDAPRRVKGGWCV